MQPTPTRALLIGLGLFLLGAIILFLWMGGGPTWFLFIGTGCLTLSALSLVVAALRMPRRPNPLDVRRERRLWKSGPLGRLWLGRRR